MQHTFQPLRIAIDVHMVGEQETGNETYILNLVRGLMSIDSTSLYLLYSPHIESLSVLGPLPRNFVPIRITPASSALRIPFGIPARARADHVDVLHVTYVAPPITSAHVVATVHDVSYELFPDTFSLRDKAILKALVPQTLRRADAIITVSESSKQDIVRRYGTPEDKITAVYQSISPAFRVLPRDGALRQRLARYGIQNPYVLAVGNLQPRKNLYRLILAYAQLRRNGAYAGNLVLVGKSKWQESELFRLTQDFGFADQVIFTGYVPEEDVVALYNGADVFVYPSLYEGFGLPPLEAMACGCPVVASETSSLPEVVGDAGLLVNPQSEDAIARAITHLLFEPELRTTLVQHGLQRVQRFSMTEAACQTLHVYERVAGRQASGSERLPVYEELTRSRSLLS